MGTGRTIYTSLGPGHHCQVAGHVLPVLWSQLRITQLRHGLGCDLEMKDSNAIHCHIPDDSEGTAMMLICLVSHLLDSKHWGIISLDSQAWQQIAAALSQGRQ